MENRMQQSNDKKTFSFSRAIRFMLKESTDSDAGLELEHSQECARKYGAPPHGGILVDLNQLLPVQRTGLVTNTNAAGGFSVETAVMPLIELLRNRMVVKAAGATVMSGLSDTIAFPKQITPGSASWVAENPGSDNPDADMSFAQITMNPKMLTSNTSFSRKLLAQSSLDIESVVRNDLIAISALALDLAALNGLGSSNQPTGILQTAGINLIPFAANGGAPSYADFVAMESMIAGTNADIGPMAWVLTPEVRASLRKTPRVAGQFLGAILSDSDRINNFDVFVTNQLPKNLTRGTASDCHAGIFGVWSAVLIGLWGGAIELLSDPYTKKKQGLVEISSYLMCDVGIRYPNAFSASKYWSAALL